MPAVKPSVIGLKDVREALQAIGAVVTQSADRKGLYAGAKVVRDVARRKAPKLTGSLRKSIIARTERARDGSGKKTGQYVGQVVIDRRAKFVVTVTKKGRTVLKRVKQKGTKGTIYPRNYAHLVEFGTKPHPTTPKHKKADPKRRYPHHPGAAAKPFLRPAELESRPAVAKAYRETVLAEVEKRARKLADKARQKARK